MLTMDMLDMNLTLYNSEDVLVFQHSIPDFIQINLMCHMTLLSNPMIMPMHNLALNILVSYVQTTSTTRW
jgi:hypothetical protein